MGHDEVLRKIGHLAEAEGIRRAIEAYADNPDLPGYCRYACVARERSTGRLYVCVIGQECRTGIIASTYLDYFIPYGELYSDYFEDLEDERVKTAAEERPDLSEQAYASVVIAFERHIISEKEYQVQKKIHEEEIGRQAEELLPMVTKFLLFRGPGKTYDFRQVPPFAECWEIGEVLAKLADEGVLTRRPWRYEDLWSLTDDTLASISEDEKESVPGTPAEKLVTVLDAWGPSRLSTIAAGIGLGESRVRPLLKQLLAEGTIEMHKKGSIKLYGLSDAREAA